MSRLPLTLLAAACAASVSLAADRATITVEHKLDVARPSETITLPWSEVNRALPHALVQKIRITDAAGRTVPYQVTNVAPQAKDPENIGAAYGELIFQHNFGAGERSATFTIERSDSVSSPFQSRAFARHVPERLDDFAWENDRIAFRTYGPALAAPAPAGVVKEVLITSGIDVWAKRVDYLIVDRWYNKGHDHYHHDQGEGMDLFGVGPSRGAGGSGVWDGKRLYVSSNYRSARVLANGPVRAVFELTYDTWAADGIFVSEVKRITLDAGRNLNSIESTFAWTGKSPTLTVATGLTKTPIDPKHNPKVNRGVDAANGTLTFWSASEAFDAIGTGVAVVDLTTFAGFAEDERNNLALITAKPGEPVRYLAGAGWTRSAQFSSPEAWAAYVSFEATRARNPVTVRITPTP